MANVMQTMKKQSVTENVPMLDILKKESDRAGQNFDKTYSVLKAGIDSGKMRIMRSGNTLLIYTIEQPGVAEFHIASLDNGSNLSKSLQDLYNAMKVAGFKILTSTTLDIPIAQAISSSKIPVKIKQIPSEDGMPDYQLTIEVK